MGLPCRILVVDDEENVRKLLLTVLSEEGYEVICAQDGEEAFTIFSSQDDIDVVLMDIRMPKADGMLTLKKMYTLRPKANIILMTAFAAVETAVQAIRLGAFDYIMKPFDLEEVKLLILRAREMQRMKEEITLLQRELSDSYHPGRILTNSPKMIELCKNMARIAKSNASVLVTGESGTGKELIAKAIHYNSPRSNGPFIKVNCSALPENLLESELFGHEKGAFTGATMRHMGRFERAHKGTLLLDEIGEISPALQVKLLRVLQEREFERVGGRETIKTDIRIIAATNQDLEAMVAKGSFRQDLYFRLNVVHLHLPPLRERPEDIFLLANYFLNKFCADNQREVIGVDEDVMALLEQYPWPGNVRELANAMERAVVMCVGSIICMENLPETIHDFGGKEGSEEVESHGKSLKEQTKVFEKSLIINTLQKHNNNRVQTAKELGISRRSLMYKLQEYEIN